MNIQSGKVRGSTPRRKQGGSFGGKHHQMTFQRIIDARQNTGTVAGFQRFHKRFHHGKVGSAMTGKNAVVNNILRIDFAGLIRQKIMNFHNPAVRLNAAAGSEQTRLPVGNRHKCRHGHGNRAVIIKQQIDHLQIMQFQTC